MIKTNDGENLKKTSRIMKKYRCTANIVSLFYETDIPKQT